MASDLLRYVAKRIAWSVSGLASTWRGERSFRLWFGVVLVSDALALVTQGGPNCLQILILGGLILCLELVNTAVENVVDLVTKEFHPVAKLAKDASSAAVALAGLLLAGAWVFTLNAAP